MTAPIALFVYRRPEHTRRAVEALKANEESKRSPLFIFSDGAASPAYEPAVQEVRDYIQGIDGFASVTLVERERNLGLANSIVAGVTQLCDQSGRVIVVEDDLIVTPGFLDYMNTALDRYADEERVMQIAGHMFPVDMSDVGRDAVFLPITTSWGWGTWARSWRHMKRGRESYDWIVASNDRRHKFDANGSFPYLAMLRDNVDGKISSWAIEWYASVFRMQGMTLFPVRTLVSNTGDEKATHASRPEFWSSQVDPDFRVRAFPPPEVDGRAMDLLQRYFLGSDRGRRSIRQHMLHAFSRLTAPIRT